MCNDGKIYEVRRRFSEFHEFQSQLIELFHTWGMSMFVPNLEKHFPANSRFTLKFFHDDNLHLKRKVRNVVQKLPK